MLSALSARGGEYVQGRLHDVRNGKFARAPLGALAIHPRAAINGSPLRINLDAGRANHARSALEDLRDLLLPLVALPFRTAH